MSHTSVALRFRRLLEQITPQPDELERVERNVTAIRSRLSASFEIVKAPVVGSHHKGTAIHTFSDVDVLAVLRRQEVQWGSGEISSATLLRRIRDDLQARYPTTSVRRDQVAAVVAFGGGQFSIDVVPAVFASFQGRPVFRIPDGSGGWLSTAPEAQRNWLKLANARSGWRLIPVVQMIKWWSCTRAATMPLRSLFVEIALGEHNVVGGPWSHSESLARGFNFLRVAVREPGFVREPTGLNSHEICATVTETQRRAVHDALCAAADRASDAMDAEREGDWRESIRQWSIVFNREFPD